MNTSNFSSAIFIGDCGGQCWLFDIFLTKELYSVPNMGLLRKMHKGLQVGFGPYIYIINSYIKGLVNVKQI